MMREKRKCKAGYAKLENLKAVWQVKAACDVMDVSLIE